MASLIQARLLAEGLPVKVWGMGADSRPFILNAVAYEVSYRGARLDGLACKLTLGEVIAVQYGSHKGRFRVVWLADAASPLAGQAGIRSVEDACIWEDELLNVGQESGDGDPLCAARHDRRQYPRFRCQGDVQLFRSDSAQHMWSKLGDLGLGGCYVETSTPEPVGTKLRLILHIHKLEIGVHAEVRTSVPALGMGVQFTSFEGGSRELLKQVVEKLSGPKLAGRTQPDSAQLLTRPQDLLAAVRDHFEGNNVMTREEFEGIVRALNAKKRAGPDPQFPAARPA